MTRCAVQFHRRLLKARPCDVHVQQQRPIAPYVQNFPSEEGDMTAVDMQGTCSRGHSSTHRPSREATRIKYCPLGGKAAVGA